MHGAFLTDALQIGLVKSFLLKFSEGIVALHVNMIYGEPELGACDVDDL